MWDIGCYFGGWGFGYQEDLFDDYFIVYVNEDLGVESESIEVDRLYFFVFLGDSGMVFVIVGLLMRFGNFVFLDEDFEVIEVNEVILFQECMIDSNL